MYFHFDTQTCRNPDAALQREWLLTNGTGSYSSSTIMGCHTRRYHGLLVANLPEGRHVLLSTLDDALLYANQEIALSTRRHPSLFHPQGYQYLHAVDYGDTLRYTFIAEGITLQKELLLAGQRPLLLIRYRLLASTDASAVRLRIRPLLAFRHFHALTTANTALAPDILPAARGFSIRPYAALPPLYMQMSQDCAVTPSPDWYYAIDYLEEEQRGFPHTEDLFMPCVMETQLTPGEDCFVAIATEAAAERLAALWETEIRRLQLRSPADDIQSHLARRGEDFLITAHGQTPRVLAGYPWFDAWGRDSAIALPGLCFCAGRDQSGLAILEAMSKNLYAGLIPNCFNDTGADHAYNAVDASLWYIWAVQQWLQRRPSQYLRAQRQLWPVINNILQPYRLGTLHHIFMDSEGLLHAGDAQTQLTWMDASVNGVPVTPRHGCPVEVNALWYNALAFAEDLHPGSIGQEMLARVRQNFRKRFWISARGGYLADVFRDDYTDASLRPNQIFAVSLPFSPLEPEEQRCVVRAVRRHLLTPYGLRTLSPDDPAWQGQYRGNPETRDSAYHQGTVWPWLLGAYTDALLRTSPNQQAAAEELLRTLTPLFTTHLYDAGIGSISEIFDAEEPYHPHGCPAQAWSVAECLRLLQTLEAAAPDSYRRWEKKVLSFFHSRATGNTGA